MGNSKSAKQLICVLLPSVQHVFGCLAGLARVLSMLPGTLKKKMTSMPEDVENREKVAKGGSLFHAMLVLVVMSVVMLAFEVVVHVKGWERLRLSSLNVLNPSHDYGAHGILPMFYLAWVKFRADYIAPSIRAISNVFIVLFLIQTVDRMILFVGWVWIKLCKIKPTLKTNLVESSSGVRSSCKYPKVLVQIPMCNEKEVYEQSISAACQLDWPKDSIVVQVLDDSDDETVQALIQHHVSYWSNYGVNIIYRHRPVRTGYKAGNLKSGMNCEYVKDCEFVVIFDADFLPKPTFLKMTIPYFKNNPDLGLVQARWTLLNKDVNLLTRLQNINMSSHFEYEQQVNGIFLNFFGFNGTAGVWRIKALKDSGGWLERTTVEDMDIAVRAHLRGWKFIFVNDVKVSCEVPESYNAYRKQQHRWHSGPVRLFFLCFRDVLSSEISSGKKANIIFLFFLLRKLILPLYSFTLSCIVLPMTMFVPEAELPMWLLYYVPVLISFFNSLPARKSFPLVVPYLLFENTMSVAKFDAVVSGILGSSYEWVVTEKTGRLSCQSKMVKQPVLGDGAIKSDGRSLLVKERSLNIDHRQKGMGAAGSLGDKRSNRIYMEELGIGVYLLVASLRSLLSANLIHFFFLFFQGFTFLLVGLDLLSEIH